MAVRITEIRQLMINLAKCVSNSSRPSLRLSITRLTGEPNTGEYPGKLTKKSCNSVDHDCHGTCDKYPSRSCGVRFRAADRGRRVAQSIWTDQSHPDGIPYKTRDIVNVEGRHRIERDASRPSSRSGSVFRAISLVVFPFAITATPRGRGVQALERSGCLSPSTQLGTAGIICLEIAGVRYVSPRATIRMACSTPTG